MPLFWSLAFYFASACIGWFTIALVMQSPSRERDAGVRLFLYPLVSLNLFSFTAFLSILAQVAGVSVPTLGDFSRCVRLTHGLAWTLFCHAQFALHGVADFRRKLTVPLIALTALNILAYAAALIAGMDADQAYRVNVLVMSLTAFYAAFSAFNLPARANDILPSAWTGLLIAGVSLIAYPLAVASDVFGYRYPLFAANRMVWEQVFPAYFFAVNVLLIRLCFSVGAARQPETPQAELTRREEDVIRLLGARMSYKEISAELQVSLSTVKTHVANAYRKLGITSYRQLGARESRTRVTVRRDYPETR